MDNEELNSPDNLEEELLEPQNEITDEIKEEVEEDVDTSKTLDKEVINKLTKRKKKEDKEAEIQLKENNKFLNAERYEPELDYGLSSSQVDKRIKDNLTNRQPLSGTKPYWKIFVTNICTFFNFILLIIFIALEIAGRYSDGFFMIIAVLNTTIGIVQEIKAKKTIDKLKLVTAPSAKIIRDGEIKNIPTDQVVLDDIMFLSSGNQIGCDSIIKSGTIEVNESLLTGESLPIKKSVGDTILAGSFVVSGSCTVQVEKVGNFCYASSLQQKAKKYSKPKSELVRSLNLIIRFVSIVLIPIGALLFWINFQAVSTKLPMAELWGHGGKIALSIQYTAGALIGMIPAGLFLLTSLALAAGVVRLAKHKTLVQELYCIEMLARVNTLCLDKTGTLTDGTMKVNEVVIFNNKINIDQVMGAYLGSFNDSNQTSIALQSCYPLNTDLRVKNTIPFSSQRKYSVVQFDGEGTFILGAPEYIYKGDDKKILDLINSKQKLGYRVVMLSHSNASIKDGEFSGQTKPIAIFILIDHIRKEAPQTIKWFNENGVQVKIISGDNPYTASNIAFHCGVKDAHKCVSLEGVSIQETKELATRYTVFGRVSPEQKAAIIEAIKADSRTVAMTGDGVNDILAMKNADCSIAMAAGADAAKNVAHLVLLDSNFASMPKVVEEGRRVINNIQRSSALFLMKTIFTFVLCVIVIIVNLSGVKYSYPLQPSNLIIMELFAIGGGSFFLALQPNKNIIKGSFFKNTFLRALPGAVTMLICMGLIQALNTSGFFEFTQGGEAVRNSAIVTMEVMCLIMTSLSMLMLLCRPFNLYRIVLLSAMTLFSVLAIFIVPPFLINIDFRSLNKISWLMIIVLLFSIPIVTSALEFICSLFRDDIDRNNKNKQGSLSTSPKPLFSISKKNKTNNEEISQSK